MYLKRPKNLRENHDKTQQYGLYEKGIRTIPIDLLIELANYYETSLDYICERTNITKKDFILKSFYLGIFNVCPIERLLLVKLFNLFISSTLVLYFLAIAYKLSPLTTT